MADRDFAQLLLAHCEIGIELLGAIASLNVDKDIAATTDVMRRSEDGDRAAILSWIASQSAQASAVGRIGEADIKSSHAKVIEQLRARDVAQLNEYVLRVLVSHRNEELAEIGKTPVEDKNLRRIVDSIRRRLTAEVKDLTRRLPATAAEVTSGAAPPGGLGRALRLAQYDRNIAVPALAAGSSTKTWHQLQVASP